MTPALGVTDVLAFIGAFTGVASLVWQIVVQRRSGRLVKVEVGFVFRTYGQAGTPTARVGDSFIEIALLNRGGAPVTVTNWGIAVPNGNLMLLSIPSWGSHPPVEVTPGGEPAKFYYPTEELRQVHTEQHLPFKKMKPWVSLGDGRRVYARKPVPLE